MAKWGKLLQSLAKELFGVTVVIVLAVALLWIVLSNSKVEFHPAPVTPVALDDNGWMNRTQVADSIWRYEDPQYGIVCYHSIYGMSCVKVGK